MTIEVAMQRRPGNNENDDKIVLGHIVPGEIATFSDYQGNVRQVVSVHCRPDDSCGEVYAFANPGYIEGQDIRLIPWTDYRGQTAEAIIPSGGNYERDVMAESRRISHLIFTHMPRGH